MSTPNTSSSKTSMWSYLHCVRHKSSIFRILRRKSWSVTMLMHSSPTMASPSVSSTFAECLESLITLTRSTGSIRLKPNWQRSNWRMKRSERVTRNRRIWTAPTACRRLSRRRNCLSNVCRTCARSTKCSTLATRHRVSYSRRSEPCLHQATHTELSKWFEEKTESSMNSQQQIDFGL